VGRSARRGRRGVGHHRRHGAGHVCGAPLVDDLGGDVNPFTIIGVGAYAALAGGILVAAGK